jgi:hypothetical protein
MFRPKIFARVAIAPLQSAPHERGFCQKYPQMEQSRQGITGMD